MNAHALKLFYSLWAVWLDHVCYSNDSKKLVITGKKQGSFARLSKLFCLRHKSFGDWNQCADVFHASANQLIRTKCGRKSVSGKGLEICNLRGSKAKCKGFFKNGLCKRMLAFFLKSIGKGEKLLLGDAFCWENVRHLRLSACDGSCLVKGNDLDLSSLLKRNSSFEKNAVFGTHSVSNHNGNRGGKTKGTGAADHKHGDSSCKSVAKFMSGKQPDHGGDNGNGDNRRYENTGNLVCDLIRMSFCY